VIVLRRDHDRPSPEIVMLHRVRAVYLLRQWQDVNLKDLGLGQDPETVLNRRDVNLGHVLYLILALGLALQHQQRVPCRESLGLARDRHQAPGLTTVVQEITEPTITITMTVTNWRGAIMIGVGQYRDLAQGIHPNPRLQIPRGLDFRVRQKVQHLRELRTKCIAATRINLLRKSDIQIHQHFVTPYLECTKLQLWVRKRQGQSHSKNDSQVDCKFVLAEDYNQYSICTQR
jgi:hypothetical protein